MKSYRLTFKNVRGEPVYEDIITAGLSTARHEGRCIAAKRGGLKFISATCGLRRN